MGNGHEAALPNPKGLYVDGGFLNTVKNHWKSIVTIASLAGLAAGYAALNGGNHQYTGEELNRAINSPKGVGMQAPVQKENTNKKERVLRKSNCATIEYLEGDASILSKYYGKFGFTEEKIKQMGYSDYRFAINNFNRYEGEGINVIIIQLKSGDSWVSWIPQGSFIYYKGK